MLHENGDMRIHSTLNYAGRMIQSTNSINASVKWRDVIGLIPVKDIVNFTIGDGRPMAIFITKGFCPSELSDPALLKAVPGIV
jgi:hypothetical protein